ncbi:MAG: porin [Cytophagales bacterium]|nr:porin [Cytophagales bacterium]
MVTGEMRPYRKRSGIFDPVPVSKPIGYKAWGTPEVGVRYSMIQMNQSNIAGGDMRTFSWGANWWLTQKVQFGAYYRFITLDRFDTRGKSSGLNFRLMLILD